MREEEQHLDFCSKGDTNAQSIISIPSQRSAPLVSTVVEISVVRIDPGKEPRPVLYTLVNPMRII